jgi:hypothetical protein
MNDATLENNLENVERLSDIQHEYYPEFQKEEGIPVYTGFYFNDLASIELKPWPRMGGLGAFVNLLGEETLGGNYLCEIPPGESLSPQRHMYEELVYILSGRGATTYWTHEGGPKRTFEWKDQSLFALPANLAYQHFNGDENKPVRLLAKTTLPGVLQYFRSKKFIFENDFVFEEAGKDFYSPEAKIYREEPPYDFIVWVANFIPDVRAFDKMTHSESRGAGGNSVRFHLPACVRLHSHQSEFSVATYKKAHAHPPGRSIIIITGQGFSLLWEPGKEKERKKIDWKPGSLFGVGLSDLQGECWYHQHFNTGAEPARYLVLHTKSPTMGDKHIEVDYVEEDPEIRKIFGSELAKSGVQSKMPPQCYTDRNFKWKK